MQEYFTEEPLQAGQKIVLNKEQAHHAFDVLHLDHEKIRLVHDGQGYFALAYEENGKGIAEVLEADPRINEMHCQVTLAIALIRREKFELILQKATELGVSRIVPFESSRCVVHAKKEKSAKQLSRWKEIVKSASEQCKRNVIPEVTEVVRFRDLSAYRSTLNCAPYENAYGKSRFLSDLDPADSMTVVIGPEGGFSEEEVEQLAGMGYEAVTLGSRILRAETAAMYACAVLAEKDEAERKP
jgi:16S rRNA (uracil1498-N3)-methyltransferase